MVATYSIENSFCPVTDIEVYNVIVNLKNKKSMDYNKLSSRIIKSVAEFVAKPISYIKKETTR